MPDLTDRMQNAPTPKPWGVGAMGTSRLGMNPKYLMALLGHEQENQQKSFADSQFESQLALSGMSPADQQMARMFRNSPAIAKVMAESRSRDESQKWRTEDREDRQRQAEEMLKERQRLEDEEKKSALAHSKAAEADMIGRASQSGITNYLRPQFAPTSAPTEDIPGETNRIGVNQMGPQRARQGVGGPKTMQFTEMAQVPTMPDEAYNYLAKKDPSNPALQGAMKESEYQQRQAMQIRAQESERMKQMGIDQKAMEKKAAEQDREKRVAAARSWIGDGATDAEIAEFDVRVQGAPKDKVLDPSKIAAQIRKDRKTAQEKELGKEERSSKEQRGIDKEMFKAEERKKMAEKWENENPLKDGKRPPMPESWKAEADRLALDRARKSVGGKPAQNQEDDDAKAVLMDTARQLKRDYDAAKARGDKAAMDDLERQRRELEAQYNGVIGKRENESWHEQTGDVLYGSL